MLGFLTNALNVYGAVAPFLRSPRKAPYSGLEAQQGQYAQALADPNNPLYQRFLQEEKQNMTQDFAGMLDQLVRRNRLERKSGRAGFIDPERGDEQLYRTFQQTIPRINEAARSGTLNRLSTGYDALNMDAQRRIGQESARMGMADQYRARQFAGLGGLAELLVSLRGGR